MSEGPSDSAAGLSLPVAQPEWPRVSCSVYMSSITVTARVAQRLAQARRLGMKVDGGEHSRATRFKSQKPIENVAKSAK